VNQKSAMKIVSEAIDSALENMCGEFTAYPIELTHVVDGKECKVSIASPNKDGVSEVTLQPFLSLDYIDVTFNIEKKES